MARNATSSATRAGHGVDEELRRRRAAPRPAPQLDEKEGGNQAQLPEEKPVEEIQRRKGAEEPRLQRQHQRKVKPRLMMHAVRGIHRHQRDDGREHQHQRAQPVHAEVVLDAQRRRPRVLLDHPDAATRRQLRSTQQRQSQTDSAW